MGNVVGVPPLHFHVDERRADTPRQRDAVRRHLTRPGRTGVQAIGVAGGQDDGPRGDDNGLAGDDVEAEHAADRTIRLAEQRGCHGFLQSWDACLDDLLAPQVHERDAGVSLHVGGDASNLARAGYDLSSVVAPKIKPSLLKLRIIGALDPLAAATRPVLIDQELIVVLDQKLRRIAGVLVGVAEQAAGDDQVAGEQRRTALADQPLADDQGLDAAALQVERRVTTRGATAHNHDIGGDRLHCKI